MRQVNWSEAPEGTTHANPDDNAGIWRRVEGDTSYHWDEIWKTWKALHPMAYASAKTAYIPKP